MLVALIPAILAHLVSAGVSAFDAKASLLFWNRSRDAPKPLIDGCINVKDNWFIFVIVRWGRCGTYHLLKDFRI